VRARQPPAQRQDRRPGDAHSLARDAAFAAQGVVWRREPVRHARLRTCGTVHFIVNNQIGSPLPIRRDTRSTIYCTDVAKMVEAPIFHVNGDDPEAVLFVTQLALDSARSSTRTW